MVHFLLFLEVFQSDRVWTDIVLIFNLHRSSGGVANVLVDFQRFLRPIIDTSVKFADLLIFLGWRVQNCLLARRETRASAVIFAGDARGGVALLLARRGKGTQHLILAQQLGRLLSFNDLFEFGVLQHLQFNWSALMLPVYYTFGPANLSPGIFLRNGLGRPLGCVGLRLSGPILVRYWFKMGGLSICNWISIHL